MLAPALSNESLGFVVRKNAIGCNKGKLLVYCLRDKHPVKRIAVMWG